MTLVSYALTTLAACKAYIGGSAATTSTDDSIIEDMINAASEMFLRVMGREWASVNASASRTFPVGSNGLVNLSPFTLRNVASITVNSETATPATLTTADYELSPFDVGMSGSGYGQLRILNGYSQPGRSSKTGLVTITGQWGWASVPPSVEFLCRQQVKQWYDRDRQNRGQTLASDDTGAASYTPALGLSPAIERTLRRTYGMTVVG